MENVSYILNEWSNIMQGEKERNIEDAHDFNLCLPTLEYHSKTWTWQDLFQAMKRDYIQVLVPQVRWLIEWVNETIFQPFSDYIPLCVVPSDDIDSDDINRLGRRNLVASDSLPIVRRRSIPTTCVNSVLISSSSTKRFY